MSTKSNKPRQSNSSDLPSLREKLLELKLAIKSHQEKNTNAHKPIKKQIAQLLLTTMSSSRTRGSI